VKKVSIISVGNELLTGQTLDSNCAYISSRLLSVGLPVVAIFMTADEIDSIVKSLERAISDSDVVVMTGGLGPTDDDITRQALAQFLGVELELQTELLEQIKTFFAKRGTVMPQRCQTEAYIPAGARALPNKLGSAPGILAEYKGKKIVALPGVPAEMRQIFEDEVFTELQEYAKGQVTVVRKLKCFGAAEAQIAEKLGNLMERNRNPLINCTVSCGVITLTIIAQGGWQEQCEKMAEGDEKRLRGILGDLVYGSGDVSLAQVVGEKLTRQNKTLSVAESCTGGLVSKLITDVPGASRYFAQGWITYADNTKTNELGVPEELINKYGAVSEEVAQAMAKCARRKADTTFAIGISGIAGPNGGTEEKPVGLVFIALDSQAGCVQQRVFFPRGRDAIRLRAALTALNMLRMQLEV